jgi:hypothetical protein
MSGTFVRTTWPFPYFTYSVTYPENSQKINFGRGYTFVSQPSGKPQRSFKLDLEGMRWQPLDDGGHDLTTNSRLNLGRLEEFYQNVELWKPFIWQHPIEGPLLVRFSRPLDIPKQIKGGNGVVEMVQVEFIEIPAAQGIELVPDSEDSRLLLEEFSNIYLLLENGINLRSEQ